MLNIPPSKKKYVGFGAGLVTLATMLMILYSLSCPKKFEQTRPAYREAGSPRTDFADATLAMFGKAQGPYVFIKCLSPTLVQVSDTQAKLEVVRLVGLNDLPYPEPTPAPAKAGAPTPLPESPALKEARLKAIQQFKIDAIGKLLGTNQLYLVRLSRQTPSPVYMLIPDAVQQAGKPATGGATMVNMLLLRKGMANMDLATAGSLNQPFFDMMLEGQLAAIIDAERKADGGESLWAKYPMQMPAGTYEDRLEDVKKRM